VGETLRRERIRSEHSLEEISASTRISQRFLKAIEAEDFDALPGLVFARNFVRQYALFLGLDPAPILGMMPQVDVETSPMPQPPNRARDPLWDPRWNSTVASIAWTLLAVGAALGAYVHFNRAQFFGKSETAPAAVSVTPEPPPVQPAAVQRAAAPEPTAEQATTQPDSTPSSPHPASAHPVEVVVAAREDAWVSASADGKMLFATILKAGESRTVSGDQLVKIRTGNAGGIAVTLNGTALNSLGSQGQARTIMLTAEGLQQPPPAAPAKENPAPVPFRL
jgi:cytoskeletal protein RodZ